MWFHLHVEDFPRYILVAALTSLSSYLRIVSFNAAFYGSAGFAFAVMLLRRVRGLLQQKPSLPVIPIAAPRWNGNLRVLTYNIFARPPLVHSNANDYKNERLALFEEHLDRFDVIALQEIFTLGTRRQAKLRDAAAKKGFLYQAVGQLPPFLSLKFIDAGLLILSRFPIVEEASHVYRAGVQWDGYAAKQIVYAKIEPPTGPCLHLFTTHTQASYRYNHVTVNALNDTARMAQVYELAQFVRKTISNTRTNSADRVMIAGDLNVNSRINSTQGECIGQTDEYLSMMQVIREESGMFARDALFEAHPAGHPLTYGDFYMDEHGLLRPTDMVLTAPEDHCIMESLDYVIVLDPAVPHTADETEVAARRSDLVPLMETRVEKFAVQGQPFGFLSDHYGISTVVSM